MARIANAGTAGLLQVVAVALAATVAPLAAQVPTPESVLGFKPGADFELATYEQSVDYFERLAAASDRVEMRLVGRTSEGRDWWVAIISEPSNLARTDAARAAATRLASGRMDPAEARALAESTLPIVDVNGGLHASEVAGAQHTIQLAYDLATSDDPRITNIRENVITVVWPSLNPDGQTMIAEWYASNLGTPYEVVVDAAPLPEVHRPRQQPRRLHGEHGGVACGGSRVGRSTSRSSSTCTTRPSPVPDANLAAPVRRADRQRGLAADDVAAGEHDRHGDCGAARGPNGQPGATVHMGTGFDAWYPGYVDYMPMLQHRIAYWTETGLYRYATPRFYTLQDFPQLRCAICCPSRSTRAPGRAAGGGWVTRSTTCSPPRSPHSTTRPSTATTCSTTSYQSASVTSSRPLRPQPPYAYFIPTDQRDPVAPSRCSGGSRTTVCGRST